VTSLPAAPERERHPADVVATVVLLVLTGLAGLGCCFMGLMLVMGSDSCGASSTCDDDVIALGVLIGIVGPILCWVTGLVLSIVGQARRWVTWWIPLVAGVAYVPVMVVAFLVVDSGVDPIR
jgi:hypothetical protein